MGHTELARRFKSASRDAEPSSFEFWFEVVKDSFSIYFELGYAVCLIGIGVVILSVFIHLGLKSVSRLLNALIYGIENTSCRNDEAENLDFHFVLPSSSFLAHSLRCDQMTQSEG